MTIERTTGGALRPNLLHDQTTPNMLAGLRQAPGQRLETRRPLAAIAAAVVVVLVLASVLVRAI
jgi:hypothetical protein